MKRKIENFGGRWLISWMIPLHPDGWYKLHTRPATEEEIRLYADQGDIPEDTNTFVSPDGEEFEI